MQREVYSHYIPKEDYAGVDKDYGIYYVEWNLRINVELNTSFAFTL